MRAWTHTRRGAPTSVLSLSNIPRPTDPPANHVLIKVTHCGLNPTFTVLMKLIPNPFGTVRVPELDFAGIVSAAGNGARTELTPGSRVFGVLPETPIMVLTGSLNNGTLTEYIVAPQDYVQVTPSNISSEAAAGLGAVGCTAIRFLDYSAVGPGASVLINGGSGGVGTFLVQLAKHTVGPTGTVVAVCSTTNVAMVKGLGADDVVAYNGDVPAEEYLARTYGNHKFDAIIDTVGVQYLYTHCPAYLKEGKTYLNMGVLPYTGSGLWGVASGISSFVSNYLWPRILGGTPRQYRILGTEPVLGMLERVKKLVESGAVKGIVDSVWDMEDALEVSLRRFWP